MPRVLLASPDQTAHLRLEPDPDGQWWTLSHAAEPDWPAWYASFGARTPVELTAAVTNTLTDPASTASTPSDPYEPLRQIGWSPYGGIGLVPPDRTATIERLARSSTPGAWSVTVTLGPYQKVWHALFGEHTPAHLVTAFTAALANPAPVARTDSVRSLPTHAPNVVTRQTTDVLAVRVAWALEERVHTLATRHAVPPAKPMPSAPPPVKNGRSR